MVMIVQKCDFCDRPAVYDGKTIMGPWAYMCQDHFSTYGVNVAGMYSVIAQNTTSTTKVCVVCGQQKPLEEFYQYVDKRGVNRYRGECKKCNLEAKKRASFTNKK